MSSLFRAKKLYWSYYMYCLSWSSGWWIFCSWALLLFLWSLINWFSNSMFKVIIRRFMLLFSWFPFCRLLCFYSLTGYCRSIYIQLLMMFGVKLWVFNIIYCSFCPSKEGLIDKTTCTSSYYSITLVTEKRHYM